MGLFSSIKKAVKNVGKTVEKVAKGTLSVAGTVLANNGGMIDAFAPGLGGLATSVGSALNGVLNPEQQASIENAVQRDGYVDVGKIENTIANSNPSLDSATLQALTKAMTQQATNVVPTATINDASSSVTIDSFEKAKQFIKKYFLYIAGALLVVVFFFFTKSGKRSRRRW